VSSAEQNKNGGQSGLRNLGSVFASQNSKAHIEGRPTGHNQRPKPKARSRGDYQ